MQLIIRLYIIIFSVSIYIIGAIVNFKRTNNMLCDIFDSLLWPGDLFNYFFCYSNNNQERISNNRENI